MEGRRLNAKSLRREGGLFVYSVPPRRTGIRLGVAITSPLSCLGKAEGGREIELGVQE